MAISVAGLFLGSILILVAAPTAFERIRWKYFLVFVCASSVMVLVVYLLFPEVSKQNHLLELVSNLCLFQTKQKSLEEISAMFGDYDSTTSTDAEQNNLSIELEKTMPAEHTEIVQAAKV